ncbi:Protein msta, isoform A [Armadillidium nasatum]|uniref:Protein msta, isoform A n=1 Tax=Armadillidium nasatum TaxID=96803 RepID=A0A5N5SK21_9CRUS|nr:Protein msta, isoform A [Armadillidium nasatum]
MPGTTAGGVPEAVPLSVIQEAEGFSNGEASAEALKTTPESLNCKECRSVSKSPRCCGGCWQVWYCSRAHQVAAWPKHQRECKPFKISQNAEMGRFLVATRDISLGELLLEDPVLTMGPKTITEAVCLACYRPVDGSFSCPDCGFPMCDRDCSSAEAHVPECKAVQDSGIKVKVSVFGEINCMYECIMPVRILALRDSSPNVWRKLMGLESNAEQRESTEVAAITQRTVVDIIHNRLCLEYSEELINQILGIIDTNAFEIRLPDSSIMGVYATGSLLEHSCIPNTHRTFDADLNLVVRAAFDIKRGQHLMSCYTESISTTATRQEHLLTSKFFTCKCVRCLDPTELGTFTSAMICPSCTKNKPKVAKKTDKKKGEKSTGKEEEVDLTTYGVVVPKDPSSPSSPWECLTCKSPLDADYVTRMTSVMTEEAEELENSNQSVKNCEAFLDKWSSMYHQNHAVLLNIKYALVHLYGSEKGYTLHDMSPVELLRKESIARQILKVADIICPVFYKACSMFQSGIIPNEMAKKLAQEAYECLLECAKVLSFEPPVQPEGQLGIEAKEELRNMIKWIKEEGWRG